MGLKTPTSWTKHSNNQIFLLSTDKSLLSLDAINAAYGSDDMYWNTELPRDMLGNILDNSLCFGVYKVKPSTLCNEQHSSSSSSSSSSASTQNMGQSSKKEHLELEQVGFARLVTDTCTFAFLTDVYILPSYRANGLGVWLLDGINEVVHSMPRLRWFTLRTGSEKSVQCYQKQFGMEIFDNDRDGHGVFMASRGRGWEFTGGH
ncbi:hypothetical protein BDV18DRAFT_158174 [Aspergillus unguis]